MARAVPPVEDEGADEPADEALRERRQLAVDVRSDGPCSHWLQVYPPSTTMPSCAVFKSHARRYQPRECGSSRPGNRRSAARKIAARAKIGISPVHVASQEFVIAR